MNEECDLKLSCVVISVMRTRTKGLWWAFRLHQVLSTIGVLVYSRIFTLTVLSRSETSNVLTGTPYFPIQIILAFLNGIGLPRSVRHWVTQWVWLLPFVILCVSLTSSHVPLSVRLGRHFGWECGPSTRCYESLGATLPFYTSIAYSLGAFLMRRHESKRGTR